MARKPLLAAKRIGVSAARNIGVQIPVVLDAGTAGIGSMDSRREYRVFGVPGAGKTTWTAEQIERAIDKHGRERVLVSSFTRAAATEIASRGIDVKHGMVGTLHSICWHALGQPPIAETEVGAFNQEHP